MNASFIRHAAARRQLSRRPSRGTRMREWDNLAVPSRTAYRLLLRAADAAAMECQLSNREGLRFYVSSKFRAAAGINRHERTPTANLREQIGEVEKYAEAFSAAAGDAALTSMLQVLAAGVGNKHYQREVEEGFVNLIRFRQQQEARKEYDEESTSERQVRIVQQATLPYAERLALLHRDDLSSAQLVDAFSSVRSRVSTHHLHHGAEQVVLDIDDELNKQTIYIRCSPYEWSTPVERVEMCEPEMLRKTTLHAQYYSIALRLAEALEGETTIHRSRGTVVVGYGVGGAVATILAMILHANNYSVKNAISFGAPKVTVQTLARVVDAISPLRFVIAGDPLVDIPITDALGDTFRHVGEVFTMECPVLSKSKEDKASGPSDDARDGTAETDALTALRLMDAMNDSEEGEQQAAEAPADMDTDEDREVEASINRAGARAAAARDPYLFSLQHYVELMKDSEVPIDYAEGDDHVWEEGTVAGGPAVKTHKS